MSTWTPEQPIVAIADVHKSFGKVDVLKGVSMDVRKGEVVCIIGPSGSGKSTLLRCVNALVPIDRGSIRVEGQEAAGEVGEGWGEEVAEGAELGLKGDLRFAVADAEREVE